MHKCPTCDETENMYCSDIYHIIPKDRWRDIKDLDTVMVGVSEILVGCWVTSHPEDEEQFTPYWAAWVAVVGDDYGCEGFYGLPPTHWTYIAHPPSLNP